MGETTDLILEGVLCESCGCVTEEGMSGEGLGYPTLCEDCEGEEEQ